MNFLVSLVDIANQILEPGARGTVARQALHDRLQTVISGLEKKDIDNTRIRKALKAGRELPGVSLGEPKEQVRIE